TRRHRGSHAERAGAQSGSRVTRQHRIGPRHASEPPWSRSCRCRDEGKGRRRAAAASRLKTVCHLKPIRRAAPCDPAWRKTAANLKRSSLPSVIRQSKKRLSLPPRVVRNWHLKRLSSDSSQGFSRSRAARGTHRRFEQRRNSPWPGGARHKSRLRSQILTAGRGANFGGRDDAVEVRNSESPRVAGTP